MNGLLVLIIALVVLVGAYLIYGRWLAKSWGIDPNAKTPAYEFEDGVDYVPAPKQVVFGHQFASIAGAGPIQGPIMAAAFGWLPVLLWLLIGGVFFGAVQDFTSMYASVKNKGKSIGYIIELYVGKTGKRLFLLFVWLFSILVVAAFADVVAGTFNGFDEAHKTILANGSAATTSVAFIFIAVAFGFFLKYCKVNSAVNTIVSILLMISTIVLGFFFPMYLSKTTWLYLVFIYVFIASVTPVWALLQPRDYLNAYLLVFMMLAAIVGVVVAQPTIHLNAFNGFNVGGQWLFPTLFVTIACGAVSGFHSLVASGTASKQIKNEKDMLPVSFGAMLLESLLGVLALIAVGAVSVSGMGPDLAKATPAQIFASGIAGFLTKIHVPASISNTLLILAFSAFALTSLDSVARVGRLSFQELFTDSSTDLENMPVWKKVCTNKHFATILTLVMAYFLCVGGYQNIWPLFGSANQLLSALALIACAVYLKKTHRKGFMLWGPMVVMIGVTFTALSIKIYQLFTKIFMTHDFAIVGDSLQMVFAVLLFVLGAIVAVSGVKKLVGKEDQTTISDFAGK